MHIIHRTLLRRTAPLALLGLALLSIGSAAVLLGGPRRGAAAPRRAQGVLREYTLVAEPVRWQIQQGLVVDGWGYNGQVPGPTLRVTEGDTVRVHLLNHLPEPTTIHWHGIDVPTNMDGVPGLSQDAVEPGDSFTYEFVAANPGTRMYHSHTNTDAQIQLGLVGALIIDPRTPEPERFDHEYTYILTEKALDFTPRVAQGEGDVLHRDAGNGRGGDFQRDLFLMNERAGDAIDPMTIAAGARIRIRLINLGNLAHAMHLHGQSFRIIATDGNPVPAAAQFVKDTVLIGPGERYDLAVEGTNAGVWMFHCHINNHAANGMSTVLTYDGALPFSSDANHGHGTSAPPPASSEGASASFPGGSGSAEAHAHEATSTPTAISSPVGGGRRGLPAQFVTPATTPTAAPAAGAAASGGGATPAASSSSAGGGATASGGVLMLDNRYVPTRQTVSAGTTIVWANNGINMHNATSLSGLWDSGLLAHGEAFRFTFPSAGTYQFLCSQHALEGMRGTITVTP